jgi:uncharacterized coiled-coil protein SlyX
VRTLLLVPFSRLIAQKNVANSELAQDLVQKKIYFLSSTIGMLLNRENEVFSMELPQYQQMLMRAAAILQSKEEQLQVSRNSPYVTQELNHYLDEQQAKVHKTWQVLKTLQESSDNLNNYKPDYIQKLNQASNYLEQLKEDLAIPDIQTVLSQQEDSISQLLSVLQHLRGKFQASMWEVMLQLMVLVDNTTINTVSENSKLN